LRTYAEIVGAYQDELIYLRDSITQCSWRIGDIANELASIFTDETKQHIYGAVADFVGKSSRTVRDYADISRFYPDDIRQQYAALSFAHFRFACHKDNWREILDYALAPEGKSHPASIDALLAKFANSPESDPVGRYWNEVKLGYERIQGQLTDEQRARLNMLLMEMEAILSCAETAAEKQPLATSWTTSLSA